DISRKVRPEQGGPNVMQPAVDLSAIPGRRIGHYRNSARRHIKLFGLGAIGASIAQAIGARGLSNVEVRTGDRAASWRDIARQPHPATNMVVIVCAEGDEERFRPEPERPGSLVTFVLLQRQGNLLVVRQDSVTHARGAADLFVTTSDRDYVADLIDNLAS